MCWNYYGGFRCYPRNPCEAPYAKTSEKSVNMIQFFCFTFIGAASFTEIAIIVVCLQPLCLPVSGWVPGSPAVNCLQIHEHPGGPDCASGHIPDSGDQHVRQHSQHLQDQSWEWGRRIFPAGKSMGIVFLCCMKIGGEGVTGDNGLRLNAKLLECRDAVKICSFKLNPLNCSHIRTIIIPWLHHV